MPNYKGHLCGAFVIYLVVVVLIALPALSFFKYTQWLVSTLAGGLFPDIDIKSKGQQLFYKLMCVILIVCILYKAYFPCSLLALCSFTPLLTKHRGLFHEFWFLVLLTSAAALLFIWFLPAYKETIITNALFFSVGFTSHLWLDLGFKRMLKVK